MNQTKGVTSGTRKGHGQPSAGEERALDDAGVHQGQTVQPVDADERQGHGRAGLATVPGSAGARGKTTAAGGRVARICEVAESKRTCGVDAQREAARVDALREVDGEEPS